jgi:ubiquinone/menaquinone biosynthesis C-methylase UbiE
VGPLTYAGSIRKGALDVGTLRCGRCSGEWPVEAGVPRLLDEDEIGCFEGLIRHVYDWIAPVHDLGVRWVLPLVMRVSEDEARDAYVRRLELDRLDRSGSYRILDVGIGSGGGLRALVRAVPPGVDVEWWGMDYSGGMLAQCERRLASSDLPPVRLLLGDAHALPFPDGFFDRVLHVGGIATYRDPGRALAEMARVAKPGTPIVVVDEQLDPVASRSWCQWLAFRLLTLYDFDPRAPREHVPVAAKDVRVEQAGPFFYCLSFRIT